MVNLATRVLGVLRREGLLGLLLTPLRKYRHASSMSAQSRVAELAEQNLTAKAKFEIIYKERLWAKASPTLMPSNSLSGHGSTEESTRVIRTQLEAFLRKEKVSLFFDAPCGDFVWMEQVEFPEDCGYVGGDIVDFVIKSLATAYSYEPGMRRRVPVFRRFITCDLTESPLPAADVWLCKDCIQHLSNADIKKVLRNFASSDIRTALISNHIGVSENRDIKTGDFRHVDLTKPPFNLPQSRETLSDKPVDDEPRHIGVWDRIDVLDAIARM